VSVDTGPLHLAASLGKPVWLVLSGASDWKWGLTDPNPWYRDARVFRNGVERGYQNSLRALTAALLAGKADRYAVSNRADADTPRAAATETAAVAGDD